SQRLAQRRQRIELTGFIADLEFLEGIERVVRHDQTPWVWDRVKLPFCGVLARLSLYVRQTCLRTRVLCLISYIRLGCCVKVPARIPAPEPGKKAGLPGHPPRGRPALAQQDPR